VVPKVLKVHSSSCYTLYDTSLTTNLRRITLQKTWVCLSLAFRIVCSLWFLPVTSCHVLCPFGGRDVTVGIRTRYGPGGPGFEPQWGQVLSQHPSIRPLGPTHQSLQWILWPFPGVKRPGSGVKHPPPPLPACVLSVVCNRATSTFTFTSLYSIYRLVFLIVTGCSLWCTYWEFVYTVKPA